MTKERCYNCGKYLTNYEVELRKVNDFEYGYCLECVKKADIETEDRIKASQGDY